MVSAPKGDRHVAWVDDEITEEGREWVNDHHGVPLSSTGTVPTSSGSAVLTAWATGLPIPRSSTTVRNVAPLPR